jgi:hypothetical protein
MTSRLDGQSSALRGHTNAKLFLNKYFAARFGQLCNLEYATSIMLVACSPDLVILNRLCASAMGHLSFTPGHDSPSIADPDLGRRQATMEDHHNLASLAHALPDQDLSGPLVAVPGDRSATTSHLLMLQASMTHSSKPLIGSTAGARGAQHTMEMPEGWVSGDVLAHACGAGHTDPADFAAADGGGHLPLERRRGGHNRCGWSGADGQSIYTTTTHLSTYAAL